MAAERTFIYALLDPRNGNCRYVGKADNPEHRRRQHCNGHGANAHKNNWISQLLDIGLIPDLMILEECSQEEWADREISWISRMENARQPLTNLTKGGSGFSGGRHSSDSVLLISKRTKNALSDLSVREKISRASRSSWAVEKIRTRRINGIHAATRSPEYREKMAGIVSSRDSDSTETRAKKSASSSKQWASREGREKILSAIRTAMTDESRKKRSKKAKENWSNPEYKEKMRASMRGISKKAST